MLFAEVPEEVYSFYYFPAFLFQIREQVFFADWRREIAVMFDVFFRLGDDGGKFGGGRKYGGIRRDREGYRISKICFFFHVSVVLNQYSRMREREARKAR